MPKGRPKLELVLTQAEREQLQSMARSRTIPAALVARARIALACAAGEAHFGPFATVTEEELALGVHSKLLGQTRLVLQIHDELLAEGLPLEGHADNLAAALAGGVCLTWDGRIARIGQGLAASIDADAATRRAARVAERVPDTRPSLALARYPGSYADSTRGTVTVTFEGDHLVFARSPFLIADLAHWHFDSFVLHWRNPWLGQRLVTFRLAADGTVEGVEWEGAELRRMSNVP